MPRFEPPPPFLISHKSELISCSQTLLLIRSAPLTLYENWGKPVPVSNKWGGWHHLFDEQKMTRTWTLTDDKSPLYVHTHTLFIQEFLSVAKDVSVKRNLILKQLLSDKQWKISMKSGCGLILAHTFRILHIMPQIKISSVCNRTIVVFMELWPYYVCCRKKVAVRVWTRLNPAFRSTTISFGVGAFKREAS